MFAKVFAQIFDSSIANDFTVRHVFMDLLVLADAEGAVDMTQDAIARRTNVPLETVEKAIAVLCAPDKGSRSPDEEGRRLLPLDSRREWGWQIVNYHRYRGITDEESRRAYFRNYRRQERKKKAELAKKPTSYAQKQAIKRKLEAQDAAREAGNAAGVNIRAPFEE